VKVAIGIDMLRAVLFGAKGTEAYRQSVADTVDNTKAFADLNQKYRAAKTEAAKERIKNDIERLRKRIENKVYSGKGLPRPYKPSYKK
jgi:hypothetical protein